MTKEEKHPIDASDPVPASVSSSQSTICNLQSTIVRPRRLRRWLKRIAISLGCLVAISVVVFTVCWFAFPFPIEKIERWPVSVRVEDRTGAPLLELVGRDDQWRYPVRLAEVSPWLVSATLAVEDHRFRDHIGIDGRAVLRAAWQDVSHLRVVSGASTLTMQVCRMMDDRPRSFWAKLVEGFRALQLERIRTKDQILELYLNIAPYGHNLRGVEAASLAYFGKHSKDLSLGEAALLAGLPQSPARYRPDRPAPPGASLASSGQAARARRETVLARLAEQGVIDEDLHRQAQSEPVALAGPRVARAQQAAWLAMERRPGGGRTTLDPAVQAELERVVRARAATWAAGGGRPAWDAAAVVLDIATGELRALVGNLDPNDRQHGQVDGATAWRSPGSALKPFVYACAFEERRLGPASTVYDVPITRAGWSPADFDRQFSGPVSAAEALRRSLNVPAILVAEGMGVARCEGLMTAAGLTLRQDARRGAGLAAVTGAVEVRLLDLAAAYATIGRRGVRMPVRLFADEPALASPALEAGVCGALDDILSSRNRRPHGMEALMPEAVPAFMWKTGTSSGRRDAWAVGHNGRYAVGVWVGRFSGEGDRGLVGAEAAEPVLADIFALPGIRNDSASAPGRREAPAWAVTNPLPPPPEMSEPPRILTPSPGATFLAINGTAIVHPRANRPAPAGDSFAARGFARAASASTPQTLSSFDATQARPDDMEALEANTILRPDVRRDRTVAPQTMPRSESPSEIAWFLNGRLLAGAEAARLALPVGSYELRCADAQGRASSVRFAVRN